MDYKDWTANGKERFTTPGVPVAPAEKSDKTFSFTRTPRQIAEDAPKPEPQLAPEPIIAPEPQSTPEPRTASEPQTVPEAPVAPEEFSIPEPRTVPDVFSTPLPRFVPEPKRRKLFPFSRKSRRGSKKTPMPEPQITPKPRTASEPQAAANDIIGGAYSPTAIYMDTEPASESHAAAIDMIGGVDGPTVTFSRKLAPEPQAAPEPQTAPEPFSASAHHVDPFSSFVPDAVSSPWYAHIQDATLSHPGAVVQSHDGETAPRAAVPAAVGYTVTAGAQGTYVLTPQNARGAQVITIQIPSPAPRKAPAKKQSLWWIPVALVLTLMIGLLGGFVASSLLSGRGATPTNAATEPSGSQPAGSQPADSSAGRIYQENVEAVVGILALPPTGADGTEYVSANAGTGFLISENGYLLTNAHVVNGAAKITVTRSNGQTFEARLVAQETGSSDLALLKIEASGLPTVRIGNSDRVQVGDPVSTIGNPLGELSFSLTTGYVSAGPRQVNTGSVTLTMLQTNAAINKGNSGGPLFDKAGQVIGVVTAKLSAGENDSTPLEGLGFALPINTVMELAEGWMANDRR
ncbi:MAG: trypsin-like peptidase domain-containing protein [Oscillospiraceae bacterium]|nr:trypsin-like peptidase domain-containing protein [Oscillospiraceae bacterium]